MSVQWYVLDVKPHKEQSVYGMLVAREVETYFPVLRVKPVNPRSRRLRPYFPGYMFIHLDLEEEGDSLLRWLPGTRGLVRFGDEAAVVSDQVIHELQRRLVLVQEKDFNKDNFEVGDRVRIVEGPFAGYEALFDARLSGGDRVQVLLAFLSQHPRRLRLDAAALKKVN